MLFLIKIPTNSYRCANKLRIHLRHNMIWLCSYLKASTASKHYWFIFFFVSFKLLKLLWFHRNSHWIKPIATRAWSQSIFHKRRVKYTWLVCSNVRNNGNNRYSIAPGFIWNTKQNVNVNRTTSNAKTCWTVHVTRHI